MNSTKDITNLKDIRTMVDSFYAKVQNDHLLGGIFNGVIQDNWPKHLAKMYRFWQTVLLNEHTYTGNPFPPHAELPVNKKHFDRWVLLFNKTIDEHFTGEKANEAKWRAKKMALLFESKIQHYKRSSRKPLI